MSRFATVVLLRCENYEIDVVRTAMRRGLALIGGIQPFMQPGERILLKPNSLTGRPPDQAVTTHPTIFQAIAEICQEQGVQLSYGDSPGQMKPRVAAAKAGLETIARQLNIPLADFQNGQKVSFPQGRLVKNFVVANAILQADGIISLPKFKTHGLTRFTGAIKNQFGCIPELLKFEYHFKFPDADRFSQMLVDLTTYLRPRLYIMDGILAMEGNGPGNGTPVPMSVILISTDPVALDATACRLIQVAPETVPTTKWGQDWDLGVADAVHIHLLGEPLQTLVNPDFQVNRGVLTLRKKVFFKLFKNLIIAKPVIKPANCNRCGTCVQVCPVKPHALNFNTADRVHPPVYNYQACIRCYCCQELCPKNAIYLRTPWPGRLLERFQW
jgi:uncharacterized protein (DUF362 family)/NAD-dependent dihydropyrimidine dehydrogenase PreA subunit